MNAVDVAPVPSAEQTQPALDLLLIFAGANIAATTLLTGASLVPAFSTRDALALVAVGTIAGSLLVAVLAPVGARLGVPSVVAARAALGRRGGALLAVLLYLSNFAWIALNNVIAASACARVLGGPASERVWSVGLGLLATAVVAAGPRAVGLTDRVAVPVMVVVGALMIYECLQLPRSVLGAAGDGSMRLAQGFDVVVGYQVSWILMFADYSRYTRSARAGAAAVFGGLTISSLWFMPIGVVAARAVGSADPGAMVAGLGLGASGALLVALASVTTNFVNIYVSALAWKTLVPRTSDALSVWSIGVVGTALGLVGGAWLDGYAGFMTLLGAALVPVGGVLLARYFLSPRAPTAEELYDPALPALIPAGLAAWAVGAAVYFLAAPIGGTLPSLAAAILCHALLERVLPRLSAPAARGTGTHRP